MSKMEATAFGCSGLVAAGFNLPLEGRSEFEASEHSEDAREFREGGGFMSCSIAYPSPKAALPLSTLPQGEG